MVSENTLVEQLKQISPKIHVLTDLEDRYVYSFEKIFMKQAYPMPDIVVKVYSSGQKEKILETVMKKNVTVIRRGEQLPSNFASPNTLILLDDIKIPVPNRNVTKKEEKSDLDEYLSELRHIGHGGYRNFAVAIQTLFQQKFGNTCLQSFICSDYCTVTPSFRGIETYSARGRGLLIKGVMKGELNLTKKVIDVLYTCSKCGRCFGECFQKVDLHEAIVRMRRHIVENNMIPQVFQTTAKNILDHGDPSAVSVKRRLAWMKDLPIKLPLSSDHLYFVGCVVANRTPNTAKTFYNILNHTKINFTTLGKNEGCCGYVLLASGLWDEAKKVAQELIKRIETTKAESVITPCAGCYNTFIKLYPEILDVSLPCKVFHSTQFLEKIIKKGEIELRALDLKVTYHDPCSLGRHSNVFDAPRNVLKAIPDLKLVEMSFIRDKSRCCGGGGGLWTFNHQVSMDSTHTRLKEDVVPINVDCLTTACPQCQMNFHITSRRKSIPLQIKDVAEVVGSAIYL
ncbi:MAG: (Fe-S)-binding protein [Candidatus Heimdallarchaeota archaeon]|nr:MAG: (Fe-S)-binding protein [Candidatus Heimdallarchaeota archaeon]